MNPPPSPAKAAGPLADVFRHGPFLKLLGVTREVSENGYARLSMPVRPELPNLFEAAHAGVRAADARSATARVRRAARLVQVQAPDPAPAGGVAARP